MSALSEVEVLTKQFADAHAASVAIVQDLNDEIEKLTRAARAKFKEALAREAERAVRLKAAIDASPDLFIKPRTLIFHGIKIGYQKQKGKLEIPKESYEQVVKLIKKYFIDRADMLIITKEEPSKKNLADLTGAELKKLGLTIEDTGDKIVIAPTDSAVDKMFKAFLKETIGDLEAA